ncbi:hypothetical protein EQH57_0139 [Dictyocoela roeselum]|nr:hypothetical protein EQH57_0139 [Dictyocoela roeselum]
MISIRQSNYFTIRAYLREIQTVTQKLTLCLDWSEQMIQEKIHELFFCGLDDSVKIEIMKYPNRDFNAIVNMLSEIELFIIQNIRKTIQDVHPRRFQNQNSHINHQNIQKTYTRRRVYFENNHKKIPKFCKYHNTNSHDTSECRALKKKTSANNNKSDKSEKTYALNEPNCNPKTIEMPMVINGKKIDVLIDTGSKENYTSEGAVKKQVSKQQAYKRKR